MSTDTNPGRATAIEVSRALSDLWSALDYPEAHEPANHSRDEMKAILGQWIHVRKAMNRLFEAIRTADPDLPGWDPIGGDRPVDQRLTDAGDDPG